MAFLTNLRQFLGRLTLGQQLALGAVLLGGIALLGGVAYWANRPEYALLFGRLEASDANRVVESLREERVPYELRDGGSAVYVPRQQVYDLRLRFAGEGLVAEGPVGYELFDTGTLGMTDFMQKLNYKRALEGELARTIQNVRGVAQARVHLVLPERSPFREQQTPPSASVVLSLQGGARLTPQQVEGVASLVSGAVEGMAVSDVSILDARGNLLSNPDAGNPDLALTTTQLRTQRAVEEHLTQNGQSMLDRVLGPGRAVVRVSAALDFSRTIQEREAIDPESATVISEERLEEQGVDDSATSTLRNYELTRVRERQEKSAGEVSYLTISVILDHKRSPVRPAAEGEAPPEPVPYPEQELREIEEIVKNAVGFKPERGDRFAIHQTRFDTSADDAAVAELRDQEDAERINLYLRYGLIALALGLGAYLVRSATRRVTELATTDGVLRLEARRVEPVEGRSTAGALAARAGTPALAAADEDEDALVDDYYTSKLSPEAKARLKAKHQMYEETRQKAIHRPEEAAELLRSWLAEDYVHAS